MDNLFTDKVCHVCQRDIYPTLTANNPENGFLDQDTGQYAHLGCREEHYKQKAAEGISGLYSEMPIIF